MIESHLDIVQYLASRECNGRRTGSPGSRAAREYIIDQMMRAGLHPFFGIRGYIHNFTLQPGNIRGSNILGFIPGEGALKNRYILIDAHYDHLGKDKAGLGYYPGADDNASSIAAILHTAKIIQDMPAMLSGSRRSIIFSCFDSEEPPYFRSENMGANRFCTDFPDIIANMDMTVVLDLMAHRMGEGRIPERFQEIFFIGGAEKSGVSLIIDNLKAVVPDLSPMRIGMHGVPPSGNYIPLRDHELPFLFLTSGKFKDYHTPFDTAEKLDYPKLERISEYLAFLLSDLSVTTDNLFHYNRLAEDDLATLETLYDVFKRMEPSKVQNYNGIVTFLKKSIRDCRHGHELNHNERSKIKYLLEIIMRYML